MTESTRDPIGPPPRRTPVTPAVQSLIKANRTAQPPATETPSPTPTAPVSFSANKQVTFYMAADDLKRAKAAYTATSGQEMDRSWSDFISRAVIIEVERRERVHNDGENFPGGIRNLAPGRKIQL